LPLLIIKIKIKKEVKSMIDVKEMNRIKKELSFITTKAIGYNSIGEFAQKCKVFDSKMIANLMSGNFNELPDRKLLRKIANNSEGRITHRMLYDICGYKETDPEEDKSWREWVPKRGEIVMCDFGYNLDCEQSGIRPALVIQNDVGNRYSPTVVVIPLSSKSKNMSNKIHIKVSKEYGLERDSYILTEQIKVVSKRGFFYNSVPWVITKLPEEKMKDVQTALEFELGFEPLMFNEKQVYKMIEHIKVLKKNIKIKKSIDLVDIFNDKADELIAYCAKHSKDHNQVIKNYNGMTSTPCPA
jgi:mRNA interferase MazF